MNYLYGDSTPSPLKSNVLDFLRDAIDFSVFALKADDRIKHGKARIQALELECEAELGRLDRFIDVVAKAIEAGEKGAQNSPTAHCAARLTELVSETHRLSIAAIRNELAAQRARIDAEENATRAECGQALATLLAPHDPPDGTSVTKLSLATNGYEAAREGSAVFGLAWAMVLEPPEPWTAPVRVERIVPVLEISTPQTSGWLTKEVKVKPQRLDQHIITDALFEEKRTSFSIRAELGSPLGFDVTMSEGAVQIARVGPADDPSIGTFDLPPEEHGRLIDLGQKLRAIVFKGGALQRAMAGDSDFHALPFFRPFAEKIIAMLTPIVREIAQHSLTPTELVIRRLLGDDRREELFIAKHTLIEKYVSLPEEQKALFAPLGLEDGAAPIPPKVEVTQKPPPVVAKKEEAPASKPPPKKDDSLKPPPVAAKKEEPVKVASKTPTLRPPPVSSPPVKASAKPPPPPQRAIALSESDLSEEEIKDD